MVYMVASIKRFETKIFLLIPFDKRKIWFWDSSQRAYDLHWSQRLSHGIDLYQCINQWFNGKKNSMFNTFGLKNHFSHQLVIHLDWSLHFTWLNSIHIHIYVNSCSFYFCFYFDTLLSILLISKTHFNVQIQIDCLLLHHSNMWMI